MMEYCVTGAAGVHRSPTDQRKYNSTVSQGIACRRNPSQDSLWTARTGAPAGLQNHGVFYDFYPFLSRVPILGVPRRGQLRLSLSMDAALDPTEPPETRLGTRDSSDTSLGDKLALSVSERMSDVTELPGFGALRIDGVGTVGAGDDCGGGARDADGTCEHSDNQAAEQNGNGKIPNRDSGIDSPSCNVEGEVFPNEDAIDEEDQSVTETETELESEARTSIAMGSKRDSTQDEDSDMDECSSGEQEGTEVPKSEQPNESSKVSLEPCSFNSCFVWRLETLTLELWWPCLMSCW